MFELLFHGSVIRQVTDFIFQKAGLHAFVHDHKGPQMPRANTKALTALQFSHDSCDKFSLPLCNQASANEPASDGQAIRTAPPSARTATAPFWQCQSPAAPPTWDWDAGSQKHHSRKFKSNTEPQITWLINWAHEKCKLPYLRLMFRVFSYYRTAKKCMLILITICTVMNNQHRETWLGLWRCFVQQHPQPCQQSPPPCHHHL